MATVDGSHMQLVGDFARGFLSALVTHRRGPRDHVQGADFQLVEPEAMSIRDIVLTGEGDRRTSPKDSVLLGLKRRSALKISSTKNQRRWQVVYHRLAGASAAA